MEVEAAASHSEGAEDASEGWSSSGVDAVGVVFALLR